jgi:hypothetical protein
MPPSDAAENLSSPLVRTGKGSQKQADLKGDGGAVLGISPVSLRGLSGIDLLALADEINRELFRRRKRAGRKR